MGLGFTFTAHNLASGTINRLRTQLRGLGGTGQTSGRMMRTGFAVAAAGVLPLAAGLGSLHAAFGAANAAAEFEQGLRRVANISGATAEELGQLRNAAIDAGIATQFSPQESVQGLANLAAQGFNAAESMQHLKASLDLAAGGQIGVDEATRATAAAIRVFSLNSQEASTVADRMLAITNATALQAGDLAQAIGTVSRGAGVAGQNMNEMLIAMGLVKNAGVEASVAASSVSSALQFMARNASKFHQIGVEVTDVDGNFRNFNDIVRETDDALRNRFTNAAQRAAMASKLFGRFGLSSFQNVSAQIRNGIRTASGEILRGAEAVDYLRHRLESAEGTAAQFRENLLNTFAGQKVLLAGTIQTLAVVLGESFAKVFAPIVGAITNGLNLVIRFFNAMPAGVKTAISGIIVAVAAFVSLAGALMTTAGLLAVIAPFALLIGKIFLGLLLILAPLILAAVAFGAALAGLVVAIRQNWGGIGDFFKEVFGSIKLAWTGLVEAVTRGGFTEGTSAMLANYPRVRQFVIGVAMLIHRLRMAWRGFSAAFQAGIDRLQPVFQAFTTALRRIGLAFGFLSSGAKSAGSALPSQRFAEFGARAAEMIIGMIEKVTKGLTWIANATASMIRNIREAFKPYRPIFEAVVDTFKSLGTEIGQFFSLFSSSSQHSMGEAEGFGHGVANAFAFVVSAIAGTIHILGSFVRAGVWAAGAFVRAFRFMFQLGAQIELLFLRVVATIQNAVDNLIATIAGVVSHIPAELLPEGVQGFTNEQGSAALRRVRERNHGLDATAAAIEAMNAPNPQLVAEAAVRQTESDARSREIAAALESQRAQHQKHREVQVINLNVDGEPMARVVNDTNRRETALGFVPVPAGS